MALGMFGGAITARPLEYTYGGTAEAPDGKADIISVKGDGDFAGKLFVDQKSHLPLMFTWMAKEPLVMNMGTSDRAAGAGGGGKAPTPEERDKMMADLDAKMKEAEANRLNPRKIELGVRFGF